MYSDAMMNDAAMMLIQVNCSGCVLKYVTHQPAASCHSFWSQWLQDDTVDCLQGSSFLKPTG